MSASDEKKGRSPHPASSTSGAPEAPTPEELREAEELSRALERGEDSMSELLLAALHPSDIDDDVHERILEAALARMPSKKGSEEPEPTPRETADATALREALEAAPRADGTGPSHGLADLARALKNAHDPKPIPELRNEALLRPALRMATRTQSRRVLAGAFVSALALAAGVFLWFRKGPPPDESANIAPASQDALLPGMIEARSTTDLFQREDFPQEGGESSRIDRISQSRASDLRNNRFVSWGVP
ncbi:MAG: hypothetical protein HOW73_06110 [Polyangiaceae bacterium]|nr:hypothetical protein [Polyangiaceae bacterium]